MSIQLTRSTNAVIDKRMVGDPVSQSSKRDGFCQKQSLIPQTGTVHPLQLDSTSDSFQVGQREFSQSRVERTAGQRSARS
jgi:hypothetical protein